MRKDALFPTKTSLVFNFRGLPSYTGGHRFICGHIQICGDHVQRIKEPDVCWDCFKAIRILESSKSHRVIQKRTRSK